MKNKVKIIAALLLTAMVATCSAWETLSYCTAATDGPTNSENNCGADESSDCVGSCGQWSATGVKSCEASLNPICGGSSSAIKTYSTGACVGDFENCGCGPLRVVLSFAEPNPCD